jgi:diguanylate cyclase (GGDEF)-like protein
VRFHHRPGEAPEALRERCTLAFASEAIADLLQVQNKAFPLEEARKRFELLQMDPGLLRAVVDEVVDDVTNAAEMLQLRVGEQLRYDEIVSKASSALVSLSLSQAIPDEASKHESGERQMRAAELQRENEELARQAATDPLTGLANRRPLDETVVRELAQAERQQAMLSVLLLDIDHFKQFNDRHGHQAGDLVLRRVANTLRQRSRRSDLCARYGGEEFAVVLPFTNMAGASEVAERLLKAVSEMSVDWNETRLSVTVSIGGVTVNGESPLPEANQLLRMADEALYRAKRDGRNRVCWTMPDVDAQPA